MQVGELLDAIRENYLSKFLGEINLIDAGKKIYIEPALRDSEGNVVTEGVLDTGSRVDIAVSSESMETINFDFNEMLSFQELVFSWEDSMTIKLNPFQWDYCPIILSGNISDWTPLKKWYRKWFAETPKENSVLFDCVHFISDPEKVDSGHQVYIDFGSADVASLEELFDAAKSMGATELVVGNA